MTSREGPGASRAPRYDERDDGDRYSRPKHARRSRSPPDFERDRARERARYEASAATGANSSALSSARGGSASRDAQMPEAAAQPEAEQPNFERSGLLAAASNSVNGVALKYHEPPEARKPKKQWRLYVFKDGKEIGE